MRASTPSSFPASQLDVRFNEGVSLASSPYVAVAMHTPLYRAMADRLMASCVKFGLALALFETPTVDQSISISGTADLSFTKPSLIRYALQAFGKPVLYLDSDMVLLARPQRIEDLAGKIDLAIYNWLADPYTDVWRPMAPQPPEEPNPSRFWAFDYAIDLYDPSQLMCTGMTQLWGQGQAALDLLTDWEAMIATYPGVADDECLDFTFNTRDNSGLRCEWLGKDYVRIPGWPYIQPVIGHPDPVSREAAAQHIADFIQRQRIDPERAAAMPPPAGAFPRNAVLDTKEGEVLLPIGDQQQLVRVGKLSRPFWI